MKQSSRRAQILRLLIEVGVFTLLFSWLPVFYQIMAAVFFSLCVETAYIKWETKTLMSQLSDEVVQKIANHSEKVGASHASR